MSETIRVYHSTTREQINEIQRSGKLYGRQEIVHRRDCGPDCNLTDDIEAAEVFAKAFRSGGISVGMPEELVMLIFDVPAELIVSAGFAEMLNRQYLFEVFASRITADPREIPDSYFERRHSKVEESEGREFAIREQEVGWARYYELPLEYLAEIVPIDY